MAPLFPFRPAIWRSGLTAVAIHLPLTLMLANDQNGLATNDAKNLARLNCGARITRISDHGTQSFDTPRRADSATNLPACIANS